MPKASETKKNFWKDKCATWKDSDLSQTAYCKLYDLNLQSFRYWLLRLQVLEKTEVPSFLPVQVRETKQVKSSGLNLMIGDIFRIELNDDFKEDTLRRVLSVLR
jgi:hypothetical protein